MCELAFGQLALSGLVAATNGLAFVHVDPVGRQISDLALAFAAAFLRQVLRKDKVFGGLACFEVSCRRSLGSHFGTCICHQTRQVSSWVLTLASGCCLRSLTS